jgi:hypothetical protein
MSKRAITWIFVGGVLAVIAGLFLGLAALFVAFAGGVIEFGGDTVVTFNGGTAAWVLVALVVLASLAMTGGGLAGLVAWIGALVNTVQLEDKTWFALLLILGVISFGWVAMLAYVIAGPDSTKQVPAPLATAPPPAPPAPVQI